MTTKAIQLQKLLGDWLVMGFDPNYAPHKVKVKKTANAICLEMGITQEMVKGLYDSRRQPYVDEAIAILSAFREVADE